MNVMDRKKLVKYIKELDEFRDDLNDLVGGGSEEVTVLSSQLIKMSGLLEFLVAHVFKDIVSLPEFKADWEKVKKEKKEKKEKEKEDKKPKKEK